MILGAVQGVDEIVMVYRSRDAGVREDRRSSVHISVHIGREPRTAAVSW